MVFVGLGSSTYEHIGLVDRMPCAGATSEFRQFSTQGSGATADAMTCLARWGESARFIGKVGDDVRGQQIIDSLEGEGVNTDFVVRQPDAVSQLTWVLSDLHTSEMHSFLMEGTVTPLSLDEIPLNQVIDGAEFVLVDSKFPIVSLSLVKLSKLKKIPVLYYADVISDHHLPILQNCDHIIVNERVAGRFVRQSRLESMCDEFLIHGPKRVTITLGSEGVVGKEAGGRYIEVPVHDVEVVDTLGADGAYFAATAYAEANQFSFEQTLRFANTTAGLVCTGFGPRSYIPSLDDIAQHAKS